MQIKTNQCMKNQKVKIQTILKEEINLLHAWSGKPGTNEHFVTERYLPADDLAITVQVVVWFGMIRECLLFD